MGKRYISVWHKTDALSGLSVVDQLTVVEVPDYLDDVEAMALAEQKAREEIQHKLDKKLML
jgi:hypothetical protein